MKKILRFLGRIFRSLKALTEKWVHPAVDTVENIKRLVDSPIVDIATGIIPGDLDNRIITVLRAKLPEVLQVLQLSEKCLSLQKFDEIVLCAVDELKKRNPDGRAAAYHSIAAMLAHYASDGKITWSEAVMLAEMVFKQKNQQP